MQDDKEVVDEFHVSTLAGRRALPDYSHSIPTESGKRRALPDYSHSMVPGGLLVTSSTTRLTSRTSFVMRVEIRASTS